MLLALLTAAGLTWRLSQGPLSLDFLTPYLEEALTAPDGSLRVDLHTTVLIWSPEDKTLAVRAVGVRALGPGDRVLASVPEMGLSVSGPALVRGIVAPRSVVLVSPTIRLVRDEQGRMEWGMGDRSGGESGPVIQAILQQLLAPPDAMTTAGNLRLVAVEDGDLVIEDRQMGVSWHAPDADIVLTRDEDGIAGTADLTLDLAGERAHVTAGGDFVAVDRMVEGRVAFTGLRPALFAPLHPAAEALQAVDMPLTGSVGAAFSLDQGLQWVRFDLTGGTGSLRAPAPLDTVFPVTDLKLRGELLEGAKRLNLTELSVNLDGPSITVGAVVDDTPDGLVIKADARLADLPVERLPGLWPEGAAPNPREWVVGNLEGGVVSEALLTLAARLPPGAPVEEMVVEQLAGELRPKGVTVHYLRPMPPITDADATVTFNADAFTVTAQRGRVGDLQLAEGTVKLTGLRDEWQYADIQARIVGPSAEALRLIDNKPLGYASALGIQPAKVKGRQETQLSLHFPLLKDLGFDQISLKAVSKLSDLAIPGILLGQDLTESNVTLEVDPKGMDVAGKVVLGGVTGDLKWRENFTKAQFRSRYLLSNAVLDDAARARFGLDTVPFQAPFMTGPVKADVTATLLGGGKGEIEVRADLAQAAMKLPGLAWKKPPGQAGAALARVKLYDDRIAEVPHFALDAEATAINGSVDFAAGKPRRVEFRNARFGRTDGRGQLTLRPTGGFDADFRGTSFDAAHLVGDDPDEPAPDRSTPADQRDDDLPPMGLSLKADKVWVSEVGLVQGVTANLSRDAKKWRHMRVEGVVGPGAKPFQFDMNPAGGNRAVRVRSEDAGAVFRAFDVFENVNGGSLAVDAEIDDSHPSEPMRGRALVSNYQVVNAPALATLLNVAGITGVLDLLRGEGITFTTLDAPFSLTEGLLEVKNARAAGPALGVTASGQIDLDTDVLALEGTVVPAYALNSVLGNIPLLGGLLVGEKGSGVFAATFSMRGQAKDPQVTVNPLAALTPGFLRGLFEIFDDGTEQKARPEAWPAPAN